MAMDHYSQEIMPQNHYPKEDQTPSHKWKSSSKAIDEPENSPSAGFDCNICLDSVHDPVVTLCGHLYCWPCIYKWIHHQNVSSENPNKHNPKCPVCKHDVSQKTLVPLYGNGPTIRPNPDEKMVDLGMVIPSRPSSPSYGAQQVNHHGHGPQLREGAAMMSNVINVNLMSPMIGEMVYGRIFGNTDQAFLYSYPNSYNLASISTQRARRQAIQVDRSLGRIWFFLFCCMVLCLILF